MSGSRARASPGHWWRRSGPKARTANRLNSRPATGRSRRRCRIRWTADRMARREAREPLPVSRHVASHGVGPLKRHEQAGQQRNTDTLRSVSNGHEQRRPPRARSRGTSLSATQLCPLRKDVFFTAMGKDICRLHRVSIICHTAATVTRSSRTTTSACSLPKGCRRSGSVRTVRTSLETGRKCGKRARRDRINGPVGFSIPSTVSRNATA